MSSLQEGYKHENLTKTPNTATDPLSLHDALPIWDFGDGSNATSATATHVYARTGTYTAKLTVRDAAGNPATTQFTVTVRPNGLLTYIEILGGIVGLLLILVRLLTWMLLGVRKKGLEHVPPAAT